MKQKKHKNNASVYNFYVAYLFLFWCNKKIIEKLCTNRTKRTKIILKSLFYIKMFSATKLTCTNSNSNSPSKHASDNEFDVNGQWSCVLCLALQQLYLFYIINFGVSFMMVGATLLTSFRGETTKWLDGIGDSSQFLQRLSGQFNFIIFHHLKFDKTFLLILLLFYYFIIVVHNLIEFIWCSFLIRSISFLILLLLLLY